MSRRTALEVIDTLTGFEEIAIEKVTGMGIDTMAEEGRGLRMIRATATILAARKVAGGAVPSEKEVRDAYLKVQALTRAELGELFEDEEDEPFEDEPVTEQGKDDSGPGSMPPSSPDSASLPE